MIVPFHYTYTDLSSEHAVQAFLLFMLVFNPEMDNAPYTQ